MTPIQQAIAILEEDALTNRIDRALEVMRGVPQSPVGREEIARIIDPVAFEEGSNLISWKHRRDSAEEKAEEILSLTRPVRSGKC